MTIVAAADYKVTFPETFQHAEEIRTLPESWKEKVDAFMAQPEIVVLKKTKRSEKRSRYQTNDLQNDCIGRWHLSVPCNRK